MGAMKETETTCDSPTNIERLPMNATKRKADCLEDTNIETNERKNDLQMPKCRLPSRLSKTLKLR